MPRILDKIIWIADLIFVETHNKLDHFPGTKQEHPDTRSGPQVLAGFTGAKEYNLHIYQIHGYIMQFSSIFKLFLCMPLKKGDDVCIIIVIRYKRKMNLFGMFIRTELDQLIYSSSSICLGWLVGIYMYPVDLDLSGIDRFVFFPTTYSYQVCLTHCVDMNPSNLDYKQSTEHLYSVSWIEHIPTSQEGLIFVILWVQCH
ncbi:hypothetical protein ACJX0J_025200, partial [Zea mays]